MISPAAIHLSMTTRPSTATRLIDHATDSRDPDNITTLLVSSPRLAVVNMIPDQRLRLWYRSTRSTYIISLLLSWCYHHAANLSVSRVFASLHSCSFSADVRANHTRSPLFIMPIAEMPITNHRNDRSNRIVHMLHNTDAIIVVLCYCIFEIISFYYCY